MEVRGKDDISTPAHQASSNLEPQTSNEGLFHQPAKSGYHDDSGRSR
ncbi:MAG: hypothetical protein HYZ92_00620 [Candidatus Omnitrophica bacterium]|nr:hypothetical protein [Candidatus Omnitrophota bacterium]